MQAAGRCYTLNRGGLAAVVAALLATGCADEIWLVPGSGGAPDAVGGGSSASPAGGGGSASSSSTGSAGGGGSASSSTGSAGGGAAGGGKPEQVVLSVQAQGPGAVQVTPPGLLCAPSCMLSYELGQAVTLEAKAEPQALFSGWSGDCLGQADCSLVLDGPKKATAEFALLSYPLQVLVDNPSCKGTGYVGRVTSTPAGIDCPEGCNAEFPALSKVDLSATLSKDPKLCPLPQFEGWGGDCSGSGDCTLLMDQPRSVTAQFQCWVDCQGGVKCGCHCVNILVDPQHCGGCDLACAASGMWCLGGACTVACQGPTTKCMNGCVYTKTDPANCGGCGKACALGYSCIDGACSPGCGPGDAKCGNACVHIQTDLANCGGCDQPCGKDEDCKGGACAPASPCGGWRWNNACWYVGELGSTCNATCANHGGYDEKGSTHWGNTVCQHFFPQNADGGYWYSVECCSTDNNTNWSALGAPPDALWSHSACRLACACGK